MSTQRHEHSHQLPILRTLNHHMKSQPCQFIEEGCKLHKMACYYCSCRIISPHLMHFLLLLSCLDAFCWIGTSIGNKDCLILLDLTNLLSHLVDIFLITIVEVDHSVSMKLSTNQDHNEQYHLHKYRDRIYS